jgi:UDPglucose 6-dehydrogenase
MKYTINVYLAQKVSYFNKIHDICERLNISYDTLRDLFLLDTRISNSHTNVPGHDGKFGFGGSCLIKETQGMMSLCSTLGLNTDTLESILEENSTRRLSS